MPAANDLDPTLYLVRVWHRTDADGARRFCASVIAAGSRSAQFFDRPDDVVRFLDDAGHVPPQEFLSTAAEPREGP